MTRNGRSRCSGIPIGSSVTDFQGFSVKTGHRMGQPCYWIINGMRGGSHLVLPAPKMPVLIPPTADVADPDHGAQA